MSDAVERSMRQEAMARALFKSFHDREPAGGELIRYTPLEKPVVCLEVGKLAKLAYCVPGGKKCYEHEFDDNGGAKVFVRYDGAQIFILGGVYRFTNRGFVR